jgi:hypothetical protein
MTTEAEYKERILGYASNQLLELWNEIKTNETSTWEPGKALEYLIIRAFEVEGAEVTYPYSVRVGTTIVEQIDGAVYTDALSCLVECKDYSSNIAIDPVAKLRNQLLRRPASVIGIVFSTTGFTEATEVLAQFTVPQTILLWDGSEIEYALKSQFMRRGLIKKYRYCIERGLPNYNISIGEVP